MSIGGKFKHAFHHATHKAKHAGEKVKKSAEHTGREVEKTADKAGREVEKVADKAKEGVEKLADLGHITDEIKHEILGALDDVKKEALSAIKSAEHEATAGIKEIGEEIKKDIEDVVKDIEEALEGKLAHEVLSDLVDVIRALSPDDVQIELGPIQLTIGNVEEKVEHFVKWSKKPPHNRQTWIAFVHDVAPETLSLVESIGLGLVIQSDDLKLGLTETWSSEKALKSLDHILAKAGIH